VTHLVDQLLGVPPGVAYPVIGALVFAEAALFVGFVLPGETAVLLGGVLASSGRLSLAWLLVLVVVAAVAGDTVGYEVGKHAGPRVLRSRPLRRHQQRLDGARGLLRRRGGTAVFLGRFTAFLRAVMPALAGVSQMPYLRFLGFNAAGGLVWGVGVTLLGFFAGASYLKVEAALGRGSAVLLAVLVLGGLLGWHRRRRARPPRGCRTERHLFGDPAADADWAAAPDRPHL
jgi:membrane-associated protein